MPQQLIPNTYRYNSAKNFVDSFSKSGVNGNHYYVFAGNHQPYANTDIAVINDDTYDTYIDVYRNMVFGKLAQAQDVSLLVKKVAWVSGTVYDMYDDQDTKLYGKNFFVYVTDGGYYYVFKCLSNNSGQLSTVQPSLSTVGDDGLFISPVDNYVWKYMYSVDGTTFDKFNNDTFMPVVANTIVQSAAVGGSIDSIKIISAGTRYDNYIQNGVFSVSDIGVFSNSYNYGISAGGASNNDSFYKGCMMVITSGQGRGQYRKIIDYFGTTITKYVVLESPFTIVPDNTSTYSIYPGVPIVSDQTQTVNAVAWAYIDPTSNSISRIEMLNRGAGYEVATANVYACPTSKDLYPQAAIVRPILSPPGGHGSNPANELYCNAAGVSVQFKNNESNTVPVTSQFRQVGLLLNPKFANVVVSYSSSTGTFTAGEYVYNFYPKRIQTGVAIDAANNTFTVNESSVGSGEFDTLVSPGDTVYVVEGTNHQIYSVNAVSNSSTLVINSISPVDVANGIMYKMDVQAYGQLVSTSTGQFAISNLKGLLQTNTIFVGASSGAYTNSVSGVSINDVQKSQSTFIEAYRYTGTVTGGSFISNEIVTQFANQASNAVLHSVYTIGTDTNFYFTNQNGIFNTSNTIYGTTSKASALLTNKYLPEVVFGSGDILYL